MSAGAIYSPSKRAAQCPDCGQWVKRWATLPWERGMCVRYHKCADCGVTFKSVQEDPTFSLEKRVSV